MAAILGLLVPRKPITTITGGSIAIPLDVVSARTHDLDATVTNHPIESGATVTDHRRRGPRRLSIVARVTDHPLGVASSLRAALDGSDSATASRSRQAMAALERAHDTGALLKVVTKISTYKNMLIERITVDENLSIGMAIEFTMDLVQITKVQLRTAEAPNIGVIDEDTVPIASPRAAKGRRRGKVPEPPGTTRSALVSRLSKLPGSEDVPRVPLTL